MKLSEYIETNGLKVGFLSSKLGITRQTLHRITTGGAISPELASMIWKTLSRDIELNVSDTVKNHIKNRKKSPVGSVS